MINFGSVMIEQSGICVEVCLYTNQLMGHSRIHNFEYHTVSLLKHNNIYCSTTAHMKSF